MRRLYLFRHGETDWNRAGRIQGHLDVTLNDEGRAQAGALLEPLRSLGIRSILSSDLSRALETARIVAHPLGLDVVTDERLREIHLGKMQGLNREEIEGMFGVEVSERLRHTPLTDADVALLGSESGEQVAQRAFAAIHDYVQSCDHPAIGIASHGGVIRRLLQYSTESLAFPPPIPNGILYPLDYDPITRRSYLPGWTPWDRAAK